MAWFSVSPSNVNMLSRQARGQGIASAAISIGDHDAGVTIARYIASCALTLTIAALKCALLPSPETRAALRLPRP